MIYKIGMLVCLVWNSNQTMVIDIKPSNNMFCESCAEITHVKTKRNGTQIIELGVIYDKKVVSKWPLFIKK